MYRVNIYRECVYIHIYIYIRGLYIHINIYIYLYIHIYIYRECMGEYVGNVWEIYREYTGNCSGSIYIGNNIYREYHGILENNMKINWLKTGK